ncbi:MAG: hypothetical protein WAL25_05540 [Acidimicrobiia bacterium]
MKYVVVLMVALVACTPTGSSATSVEQRTVTEPIGFPCVSQSGGISGDSGVTVESNGHEVSAAAGWISAGPCPDEGGEGVVNDGLFAGLKDLVVPVAAGDTIRVRAPGFSAAEFEAAWSGADGSESGADVAGLEAGVWEIAELPGTSGSYVLNLRFVYGEDQDAAFAVTVDLQN